MLLDPTYTTLATRRLKRKADKTCKVILTAGQYEVALVVVKGVEGELHRLADNCDVASHFVVDPLVTEDLKSSHLKEFKRYEETIHLI